MVIGIDGDVKGYHLIYNDQCVRHCMHSTNQVSALTEEKTCVPVYIKAKRKYMNGFSVPDVGRFRCDIISSVDRENRQSIISCPIDPHKRSAILTKFVSTACQMLTKPTRTSSALKMTYSLIVSWPRIEWYIMDASVRGLRMIMDMISSKARRTSAFWDGGNGGAQRLKVFASNCLNASTNRMGRIVKV
jgi:hypothetical protein